MVLKQRTQQPLVQFLAQFLLYLTRGSLLLMKKREPSISQPRWGNVRRNMRWFVRGQGILCA